MDKKPKSDVFLPLQSSDTSEGVVSPTTLTFARTNWDAPQTVNADKDWYIEESRIRGGYNNTTVDFGVKAYVDEDNPVQQDRINTLIYSGIYNSRTGINQTNQ